MNDRHVKLTIGKNNAVISIAVALVPRSLDRAPAAPQSKGASFLLDEPHVGLTIAPNGAVTRLTRMRPI